MAFACNRVLLRLAPRCRNVEILNSLKHHPGQGVVYVQVANLTSAQAHGQDVTLAKPFPYEKRPYSFFWQIFDKTRKRFNDNSKVIVIDGNLASGKTEFGEKLAKEFNMKFFPDEFDDKTWKRVEGDIDYRILNERLSPRVRFLDVPTFQMHTEVPAMLQTIARTQLHIYRYRYYTYAKALAHLLNTGQGVIVERGPWGDVVFAETLRKLGYISQKAWNYYQTVHTNSVCEFWKPHLVIYLDAPISSIRKRVNARNSPSEMKGKVVTDEYLKTVGDLQKTKLLSVYEQESKVITLDLTDMPDWEVITEDLEVQDLEFDKMEGDLFSDWGRESEDEWNLYRVYMSNPDSLETNFRHIPPMDCPEVAWIGEDFIELNTLMCSEPEVNYTAGYCPGKDNYLFKW